MSDRRTFLGALAVGTWTTKAALGQGQTLSQGDRDFAMSSLYATRKRLLDAAAGLSKKQQSFKPSPDRWSIAECVEHLALSEDRIAEIAKSGLKNPAEPDKAKKGPAARAADQKLLDAVADRTEKHKAPEMIQPSSKFPTVAAAIDHFRGARDANIDYIRTTQDELRSHFVSHPAAGPLDVYQWFLLLSAHTERHVLQIEEVKADPGYPKK